MKFAHFVVKINKNSAASNAVSIFSRAAEIRRGHKYIFPAEKETRKLTSCLKGLCCYLCSHCTRITAKFISFCPDEAIIPPATLSLKYFENILKKTDYSYPSLFTSATNTAWPNLDPNWGPYKRWFFRILRDTSKPNSKTKPLPISPLGNSSNFSPGIPGAPTTNVWLQPSRMCPIATDQPARQAGCQWRSVGVMQSCNMIHLLLMLVEPMYVRPWSYVLQRSMHME